MQRGNGRSIDAHIEGTVTGQIAVGEHIVQTGDVHGDVVLSVAVSELPAPQPHPSPVVVRPRPFADLLDRQEEMRQASQALQAGQPIGLCAEEGMGKSALLRRIAYLSEADAFPDGVVYLSALHLQEADLRQELFNAFYECKVPTKPTDAQIQHALQAKRALILLDDVGVSREEAEALMSAAPRSTFLLASEERLLWGEGCGIPLHGLPAEAALALIARELGRPLAADELPQARALCEALHGHPLRIIQAAAAVREEKRTFAVLAVAARSPTPAQALAASLAETLSEPQHRTLLALATLAGAPTGAAHVAAISGNENAAAALEALQRLNVVQEDDQQYRLTGLPAAALPGGRDMAPWVARAMNHFASWGERLRGSPRVVLGEAPAIVALISEGAAMEQWGQVLRLVRVAEGPLTLAGRWQAWETVLQHGLTAARALGDPGAEAWALHQAGVRALSLGDSSRAQELLRQALDIRRSIGDRAGAALTKQNLDIASGAAAPPPAKPPAAAVPASAGMKAAALKLLAVLLVLGGGGYLLSRAWSAPKLTALQLRPPIIDGGGFSTLTIALDKPAPAGGLEVTLATSDNAARVPDRVTIPAGSRSASLLIGTTPVRASIRVSITAAHGRSRQAAGLEIRPVSERVELHLTLAPPTVTGGGSAQGTVELNKPAAAGGVAAVHISQAGLVRAPASLKVPPGATRLSFKLDTRPVTHVTPVTVTVSYAGDSKFAVLRLQPGPAQLAAIAFDRPTVTAGEQVGGMVTLSGPAPEGGALVSLSPSSSAVRVNSSLRVLEGKTSARFVATAAEVNEGVTVYITASLGTQSKRASLTVGPVPPRLATLAVTRQEVRAGARIGVMVGLDRAVPEAAEVSLSSDRPEVTVPATVRIERGRREATVAAATAVVRDTVTATLRASYGGVTKSTRVRVLGVPAGAELVGLTLDPTTVQAGETATGTVKLSNPAPSDVTINLIARSSAVRLPNQVTVSAGRQTAQFRVRTDPALARSLSVTIIAAQGTSVTKTTSLTIEVRQPEAELVSLALAPKTAGSGDTITGTITLSGPAPAGGAAVTLKAVLYPPGVVPTATASSAAPSRSARSRARPRGIAVACPSPVVVPAGRSHEQFEFRVPQLSAEGTYKIVVSASYRDRPASDTVTVIVLR